MYTLKQKPEDFVVKEIPSHKFGEEGHYLVCLMKKVNYNTEDAIQTLSKAIGTTRKNISYAGSKDRNAVTYQYITLYKGTKERIENITLKDISLQIIGRSKAPLSLGDLEGNDFEITVRNLGPGIKPKKIDKFPNLFDEQRFSKQNDKIGKLLVQKKFKEVCELIKQDGKYGERVKAYLDSSPNNYVGAIKTIPVKILLIYVHAFQSKIWNESVEKYLKGKPELEEMPMVGFSDLDDNELKPIIQKILKKEGITNRDFIIREFPEISPEGTKRKMLAEIKNFEFGKLKEDELNPGKQKVLLKFALGKGSYATMAVKFILKEKLY